MNFQFKEKIISVKKEKKATKKSFKHGSYVMVIKGSHKGSEGYVKKYYPGSYEVRFDDGEKMYVKKNEFKFSKENNIVYMKSGKRLNEKALILKQIPSHLMIEIYNRKFNINVSDVFYKDLLLKSGKIVQVVELLENGRILVDILDNRNKERIDISSDDIKSKERGFEFEYEKEVIEKGDVELNFENEEDFLNFEKQLEVEEKDATEFDENEFEEQEETGEDIDFIEEEDIEYKSGFKDKDRLVYVEQKFTKDQEKIKTKILSILKNIDIHEEDINIHDTISKVEDIVEKVKRKFKINLYDSLEINYIIACIVFYQLMKNGNFKYGYNEYISELSKVLKYNKILISKNSLIIKIDENIEEKVNKTEDKVLLIANEYRKYMNEEFNIYLRENSVSNYIGKLIPLGRRVKNIPIKINRSYTGKYKSGKEYVYMEMGRDYTVVSIYKLLSGVYPEKEAEIDWIDCEDVLLKFKKKLEEKKEMVNDKKSKESIQYIIDNLHRSLFLVKKNFKELGIDEITFKYLKQINDQLIDVCSGKLNKIMKKKSESTLFEENPLKNKLKRLRDSDEKSKLIEMVNLEKKRKRDMSIKRKLFDESDDEEVVIKNTGSYIRESRKRELKKMVISRTRQANIENYRANKKLKKEGVDSITEEIGNIKITETEISELSDKSLDDIIKDFKSSKLN